jgi:hypothetical protein
MEPATDPSRLPEVESNSKLDADSVVDSSPRSGEAVVAAVHPTYAGLSYEVSEYLRSLAKEAQKSFDYLESFYRSQIGNFQKIAEQVSALVESDQLAKNCIQLGMFPHSAVLRGLRDFKRNGVSISNFDELHSGVWPKLKEALILESSRYAAEIDRRVIREAIHANEVELFNLVPPSMFAHIERASRALMAKLGVSGQIDDWLMKEIGELGLSEIGGLQNMELYRHLCRGAYESVRSIEVADQIHFPNRHAVIHGIAERSHRIDSINAVLFGNFVFSGLTAIEQNRLQKAI